MLPGRNNGRERLRQASYHTFLNQSPLVLSQRAEHVKQQLSVSRDSYRNLVRLVLLVFRLHLVDEDRPCVPHRIDPATVADVDEAANGRRRA